MVLTRGQIRWLWTQSQCFEKHHVVSAFDGVWILVIGMAGSGIPLICIGANEYC